MTTSSRVNTIVQTTDPDFLTGFEEAHEPYCADCHIRTDLWLAETVQAMLTEVAVESGLSDQQLQRSTGFIIDILSLD